MATAPAKQLIRDGGNSLPHRVEITVPKVLNEAAL